MSRVKQEPATKVIDYNNNDYIPKENHRLERPPKRGLSMNLEEEKRNIMSQQRDIDIKLNEIYAKEHRIKAEKHKLEAQKFDLEVKRLKIQQKMQEN